MTNNEAELMAVYQGIRIAIRNGYTKLEIEGDLQLVVEMLRKLNNGKDWEQVAKSWRTTGLIQDLEDIMEHIDYKIINHVRRDGKIEAKFLANWGCNEQDGKVDSIWPTLMNKPRWETLNSIITQDNNEITIL